MGKESSVIGGNIKQEETTNTEINEYYHSDYENYEEVIYLDGNRSRKVSKREERGSNCYSRSANRKNSSGNLSVGSEQHRQLESLFPFKKDAKESQSGDNQNIEISEKFQNDKFKKTSNKSGGNLPILAKLPKSIHVINKDSSKVSNEKVSGNNDQKVGQANLAKNNNLNILSSQNTSSNTKTSGWYNNNTKNIINNSDHYAIGKTKQKHSGIPKKSSRVHKTEKGKDKKPKTSIKKIIEAEHNSDVSDKDTPRYISKNASNIVAFPYLPQSGFVNFPTAPIDVFKLDKESNYNSNRNNNQSSDFEDEFYDYEISKLNSPEGRNPSSKLKIGKINMKKNLLSDLSNHQGIHTIPNTIEISPKITQNLLLDPHQLSQQSNMQQSLRIPLTNQHSESSTIRHKISEPYIRRTEINEPQKFKLQNLNYRNTAQDKLIFKYTKPVKNVCMNEEELRLLKKFRTKKKYKGTLSISSKSSTLETIVLLCDIYTYSKGGLLKLKYSGFNAVVLTAGNGIYYTDQYFINSLKMHYLLNDCHITLLTFSKIIGGDRLILI